MKNSTRVQLITNFKKTRDQLPPKILPRSGIRFVDAASDFDTGRYNLSTCPQRSFVSYIEIIVHEALSYAARTSQAMKDPPCLHNRWMAGEDQSDMFNSPGK